MQRRTVLGALPVALVLPASDAIARTISPDRLKTLEELAADAHAGVSYISVQNLQARLKENRRLVLVDVRTAQEYDGGRIKGSAWVERGVAEWVMVRQLPDPDAEIVIYCKVGHRTGFAVKALQQVGYRNVVGLEGGFDEWARQGNLIETFLGEFRLVKLTQRNASTPAVDFFAEKSGFDAGTDR